MAKQQPEKIDNYSIMMGLDLSSRALADYFSLKLSLRLSLKKEGKSKQEIEEEIEKEINKQFSIDPSRKPPSLAQLVGEFTYSFLGSKDIKAWASKEYLGKMPDERKYALKLIGKKVEGNKIQMPEEQRGFDYIVSHLRYLKAIKSEDESKKKEAYEKLRDFFSKISGVAESEIGELF